MKRCIPVFYALLLLPMPLFGMEATEATPLHTTEQKTVHPRSRAAPKKAWNWKKACGAAALITLISASATPEIALFTGINDIKNVASPIRVYPYREENGMLVPPPIIEKPQCTYTPYKDAGEPPFWASGHPLCSHDGCNYILETCGPQNDADTYAYSYANAVYASIVGLGIKIGAAATTIVASMRTIMH